MDERGWTREESTLTKIRFLDWVAEYQPTGRIPGAVTFLGDPETVDPGARDEFIEMLRSLHAEGLINDGRSLAGWSAAHATLTHRGLREVHARRERRNDDVARAVASRDAMLDWLYASKRADRHPNIDEFYLDPRAHFEGEPFSEAEGNAASNHLKSRGLIKGGGSWGGGVPRPEITSDGGTVVEQAGSLAAWDARQSSGAPNVSATYSGTFHGPVATGQDVTQTQNVGADLAQLSALISVVREQLNELPENEISGADAYLTMIEAAAAEEEPNRKALEVAGRGLANLGDKASGALVGASIRTLWVYLATRFGFPTG